jgi:hypothetical protein
MINKIDMSMGWGIRKCVEMGLCRYVGIMPFFSAVQAMLSDSFFQACTM